MSGRCANQFSGFRIVQKSALASKGAASGAGGESDEAARKKAMMERLVPPPGESFEVAKVPKSRALHLLVTCMPGLGRTCQVTCTPRVGLADLHVFFPGMNMVEALGVREGWWKLEDTADSMFWIPSKLRFRSHHTRSKSSGTARRYLWRRRRGFRVRDGS